MADPIFEHAREVREALHAIVSDHGYGAQALSDPVRMTNLLRDLMPDAPRETGLLIAAAQARLAEVLRGHASNGLDALTAARLAAANFAANTAFSPEVCAWVTGELAIALALWAATDLSADSAAGAASSGPSQPPPVVTREVAQQRRLDAATELPFAGAPVYASAPAPGVVVGAAPGVTGAAPVAEPRRRRLFRRWMLIPIGLVVTLSAIGGIIGAVTSSSAPRKLTLDQFRVGDCLRGPNLGLHTNNPWPYQVEGVSCTAQHKAEVFFTGVVWPRSLAYPPLNDILSKTDSRCGSAFRGYVGIAVSESEYNLTGIYPDKGSWASGNRSVQCVAYKPLRNQPGGALLYKSIKGSRR